MHSLYYTEADARDIGDEGTIPRAEYTTHTSTNIS